MEVKIISEKENQLLKRKEVRFHVKHVGTATPPRGEIRKAVADALKANVDLVFVKSFETRPGMHIAAGVANQYDSVDHAKLVEPEYVLKRNAPPPPKANVEEKKE